MPARTSASGGAASAHMPARARRYLRVLWGVMLAVSLVCAASSARAENLPSVVISPHFQVFTPLEQPDGAVEKSEAFYQGAVDYALSQRDRAYLVSAADLARAVKTARGYEYRQQNADLATKLGIDHYKRIDVDAAVTYLESALETYQALQYDLVDAGQVAEVALYLALSYIEQDNTTLKLFDRLQTMTLLDPGRRIRPGFYSDQVARIYRSARDSLVEILRAEGPPAREAQALAELADSDYAVFGYAWPMEDGGYEVVMHAWARREARFLEPERLQLSRDDADAFRDAGNRLLSRYLPRLMPEPQVSSPRESTLVQSDGLSPFSLEFGFVYASFMRYPYDTRARTKPWGNYGLGVAGRVFMTRDFALLIGAHILNSSRDYSGFLFDDFSTLRGFLAGDMGLGLGDFNLGIQLGLEVTTMGDFDACPEVSALCAERADRTRAVRITNRELLMGINARPRVIWNAYRQFSLIASGSASYYFIPLSGRKFNYPLTGQLDVSYRF